MKNINICHLSQFGKLLATFSAFFPSDRHTNLRVLTQAKYVNLESHTMLKWHKKDVLINALAYKDYCNITCFILSMLPSVCKLLHIIIIKYELR